MSIYSRIREAAKWVVFRTGLFRAMYPYNLNPIQLAWLCESIERSRTNQEPGCIVEAGVSRGMTSFFLTRHLHLQYDKRAFIAVDTFSGFDAEDVDHEIR